MRLPILILGSSFLLSIPGHSYGRIIESWPYDKLFEHADLVVVLRPLTVRDAVVEDRAKPPRDYLEGVVTKFKVMHAVKGEYVDKELELLHFRLKEGARIVNGPMLVSFHTKPIELEGSSWKMALTESEYLVFLRKNEDGSFGFVSGQFDPSLSVKQLLEPLP